MRTRHPDEAVAVVSHGGPIALFCQTVLGLPYRRPMPFAIDNCSLNVIEVSGSLSRPAGRHAGSPQRCLSPGGLIRFRKPLVMSLPRLLNLL